MTTPQPPLLAPPAPTSAAVETFDRDPVKEKELSSMEAAGVRVEDRIYVDTFSFHFDEEYEIPNSGGQKIFYARLTEGKKSEFQKLTNQDVRIQRTTGDAKLRVDPASERHTLIRLSVTNWDLVTYNQHYNKWEPVPFNDKNFARWMNGADPSIVKGLEREIRKKNEWMNQDFTIEGIDEQIKELQERRKALVEAKEKEEDF